MAFSPMEVKAIENMLPAMGEFVSVAGIGAKPFNDCSREEILGLFAHTVKTYRACLQVEIGDGIPF